MQINSLASVNEFFVFGNCGAPHGIAVAVATKNSPQDCVLDVTTVLKEIICPEWVYLTNSLVGFGQRAFCFSNCGGPRGIAVAVDMRPIAKKHFCDIINLYFQR